MARFAAFLRGMNLGGRRITNDDLRAHVAALGFEEVATFRASGNVVVEAPGRRSAAAIARELEAGLRDALGYDVPVFLRTAAQVRAIAERQPFPAELIAASGGKLQVSLLGRAPSAKARTAVEALATDDDRLVFHDTELYWLPRGGLLESELDLNLIDRTLGRSTRRTKGTMDQLAVKHFS